MKTKKFLSFVMAIAMMLSLAATAMASNTPAAPTVQSGDSLTHAAQYTGNTSIPEINLALSAVNTTLAFNPYKLAVKVDTDGTPNADATGNNTVNDQLITKEIKITNLTNVPLKMLGDLKVTTSLGAGAPNDAKVAEVTNKAIAATETAKKLYVYADFYAFSGAYSALPERTKTAASAQRLVAPSSGSSVTHTLANRVVMQATDGTHPNYVYVKVNGEATRVPQPAWGAYDKVQIDLAFTFEPQPNVDKYAIVDKANSSATTDFTVNPTYSDDNLLVPKASSTTDLANGVAANAVPGSVCYIIPATGKKITTPPKFYEKTGTTAITTVKATSTNSKDPTAPWTFTMPEDNVFIEVTVS